MEKKGVESAYRDIYMDTAKGITMGLRDIHMGTARGDHPHWNDDISMDTAKNATTMKQTGLKLWERELLESSEVKRKATVAQLCTGSSFELDHMADRLH